LGIGEVVEQYVTAETLESKTEQWMQQISAYRRRQSALLVVDTTRPFVDPGRPLASPKDQRNREILE